MAVGISFLVLGNVKVMLNPAYLEVVMVIMMIHGFNYPDETGIDELSIRLFRPVMRKGVIKFPRPEECSIVRKIKKMKPKQFDKNNMQSVEELFQELGGE